MVDSSFSRILVSRAPDDMHMGQVNTEEPVGESIVELLSTETENGQDRGQRLGSNNGSRTVNSKVTHGLSSKVNGDEIVEAVEKGNSDRGRGLNMRGSFQTRRHFRVLHLRPTAAVDLSPSVTGQSESFSTRTVGSLEGDSEEDESGQAISLSRFSRQKEGDKEKRWLWHQGEGRNGKENKASLLLHEDYYRLGARLEGEKGEENAVHTPGPSCRTRCRREPRTRRRGISAVGGALLVASLGLILASRRQSLFSVTSPEKDEQKTLSDPSSMQEKTTDVSLTESTPARPLSKDRTTQTPPVGGLPDLTSLGRATEAPNLEARREGREARSAPTRRTTRRRATEPSDATPFGVPSTHPETSGLYPPGRDISLAARNPQDPLFGKLRTSATFPRIIVTPPGERALDEVDIAFVKKGNWEVPPPVMKSVAIRREVAAEKTKDTAKQDLPAGLATLPGATVQSATVAETVARAEEKDQQRLPERIALEKKVLQTPAKQEKDERPIGEGVVLPSLQEGRGRQDEGRQTKLLPAHQDKLNDLSTGEVAEKTKAESSKTGFGPSLAGDTAFSRAKWIGDIRRALDEIQSAQGREDTKQFLGAQPETSEQWMANIAEEIRLLSKAIGLEGTTEQRPLADLQLIARTGDSFSIYLQLMVVDHQLGEAVTRICESRENPVVVKAERDQILELTRKIENLVDAYMRLEVQIDPSGTMEERAIPRDMVRDTAEWAAQANKAVLDQEHIDFEVLSLVEP
ncbi:hypothetical protein CSUI_002023 [Cystoisospora suis]|uniref:Uncharacterized protein n=1 Tax=Cystoisospora suis TaxID=483139 RepID=A0A2C6LAH7_9APIC|nr:hypothetical protein CSUI_002023 [Cystoisospora suis]